MLLPDLHTDFSGGRSGGLVSLLLKNFPQFVVTHTVKGFDIVNKTEVDIFWNSLAFLMIQQMLTFWSLVFAFSKSSLNIWKFMVRVLLNLFLGNFEHYLASVWEMSANMWQFEHSLALPFFGIGMKTDLFQSCGTAEFSRFPGILSAALSQHHLLGFEIAQLELYLHCS